MFHVLAGRFRILCGEESFEATEGATVVLPRDVAHRFQNIGGTPGRMLVTVMPGGFETFFLEVAALPDPDMDQINTIAARYGLEFIPETVSRPPEQTHWPQNPRLLRAKTDVQTRRRPLWRRLSLAHQRPCRSQLVFTARRSCGRRHPGESNQHHGFIGAPLDHVMIA